MRVFSWVIALVVSTSSASCIKTTEGIRGDLGLDGTLFEGMVIATDNGESFGDWEIDGTSVKCQQTGATANKARMKCSITDASGAALSTVIPTAVIVSYGTPDAEQTVVTKTIPSGASQTDSSFDIEVETSVAQSFVGVSPSEIAAQP